MRSTCDHASEAPADAPAAATVLAAVGLLLLPAEGLLASLLGKRAPGASALSLELLDVPSEGSVLSFQLSHFQWVGWRCIPIRSCPKRSSALAREPQSRLLCKALGLIAQLLAQHGDLRLMLKLLAHDAVVLCMQLLQLRAMPTVRRSQKLDFERVQRGCIVLLLICSPSPLIVMRPHGWVDAGNTVNICNLVLETIATMALNLQCLVKLTCLLVQGLGTNAAKNIVNNLLILQILPKLQKALAVRMLELATLLQPCIQYRCYLVHPVDLVL
mmetsp:Transcript_31712/g.57740  ORF Transcript_31712/g.57740 Transcript_31712/m.57740 type:complete len:272 (-) Transcript_31712:404-1219(-)